MAGVSLEAERIILKPAASPDAQIISAWKSEAFFRKMALDEDTVTTVEKEEESITRALETESELYVMILLKATNLPIGYIRINWMDSKKRSAWLRFALGTERGKGYARDALSLLLPHLFSFGCHRVEAEVYDFNTRSIGLLESLGFVREGVKRDAHYDSDGYHDVVVLGLLKSPHII